jgi:hypothetical protein
MRRTRKKETVKLSRIQIIFITAAVITAASAAAAIAMTLWEFRYPKINSLATTLILGALIILPLPAAFALKYFWVQIKIGTKMLMSFALSVILAGSIVSSFFFIYASPIESLTDNARDYLKTEAVNSLVTERISQVFPDAIPTKAEKIAYHYNYSDCVNRNIDIYARWKLSDAAYSKEKNRILSAFPDAHIQDAKDFSRVYIKDEFSIGQYEYLVFLYNDQTKTVAYAYSSTDNIRDGCQKPYFMQAK